MGYEVCEIMCILVAYIGAHENSWHSHQNVHIARRHQKPWMSGIQKDAMGLPWKSHKHPFRPECIIECHVNSISNEWFKVFRNQTIFQCFIYKTITASWAIIHYEIPLKSNTLLFIHLQQALCPAQGWKIWSLFWERCVRGRTSPWDWHQAFSHL